MQTPKARSSPSEAPRRISPRAISSEVPLKISPRAVSSEVPQKLSPRVVRQLKTTSQDSDSASSSSRASRTPRDRSSKVGERRSPRSPVPEKKQSNRVAELEFQISQLQSDLKKVKDQLESSEAWKEKAVQDAEESKKQLLEMSLKLEESQQQVLKQLGSKEANTTEPQNVSEDHSLTLESELESLKKQHSSDSSALATAVDEIKQLKVQLDTLAESEAAQTKNSETAQSEVNSLKENLSETLVLMEDLKSQLRDCKASEARAQGIVGETLMQLETAKKTVEILRSDGKNAFEAYDAMACELEQSRARVNFLETLVGELKADINSRAGNNDSEFGGDPGIEDRGNSIEAELTSLKSEVEQLRSALEAAETRFKDEHTQNALQLKSAYELVEQIKSSSGAREAKLESELMKSRAEIEELRANLMDKETELQGICEENESLNMRLDNILPGRKELEFEKEIQKAKANIENLKANLMDKETELQNILEENEILKLEIKKKEINNGDEAGHEILQELEAARASEREANMKLGHIAEEVDKSNRKVARVSEQLEAAQTANSEMEAELRKLKVQSDQWRKAAEAAAAMLSTGNNGKFMERTGSMESKYSPRSGRMITPPPSYSEDVDDDDFLKKKNQNMLKKIGVLWKKPHK